MVDPAAVAARVEAAARTMSENLDALTLTLHGVLSEQIHELQGDAPILDLLRESIDANLRTLTHAMLTGTSMDEVAAPPAAQEYARRLSQRGISSNALLRAYRLGQESALSWLLEQIQEQESDPEVAFAAGQLFMARTFRYIDAVSEQVVSIYEAERERWLANRNTVRAAVLDDLLEDRPVDVPVAESALGYRLRQFHLGVVLRRADAAGGDLGDLERLLARVARAFGSAGQPLFIARDRESAWGWIPLGRNAPGEPVDPDVLDGLVGDGLRLALGVPDTGPEGFRRTHADALRAQEVAMVAQERAATVTSYGDGGVRTAAMLASDLPATRRLVVEALGDLAADTEAAERLRTTLQVFLGTRNSFAATAELVHLHKNTVKYRIDKAVEARGRPLHEDRLDLELALTACRWLGTTVLTTVP